MLKTFDKIFMVSYADLDYKMRIKPSSVLNFFQCVAGDHSDILKVGKEDLDKLNIFWVLNKVSFDILAPFHVNQRLKVTTWPLQAKKIIFERDYEIKDADNDDLLAIGTSRWCVLSKNNHKIMPSSSVKYNLNEYENRRSCDNVNFNFNFDGYLLAKEYKIKINYTHLDYNLHANNIKYADFAMASFTAEELKDKYIKAFQINYCKECREGEMLEIKRYIEGNSNIIIAKSENKDAFQCHIELEKSEK